MNVSNFTKFHTWKLFLYGSCKKGLHYTWSKFVNWSDTKYEKLFWKRRVTVGVLFCKETLYMPKFMSIFWQELAWERLITILATGSVFCLFWRWYPFKSSHFVHATISQDTAVLKCCPLTASNTAISAFRKVSGPVSGLIYQEEGYVNLQIVVQIWNCIIWEISVAYFTTTVCKMFVLVSLIFLGGWVQCPSM